MNVYNTDAINIIMMEYKKNFIIYSHINNAKLIILKTIKKKISNCKK